MTRHPPLPQSLAALPAVMLLLFRLRRAHGTSDMKGLVAAATPGAPVKPLSRPGAEAALRVSRTLVRRLPRLFPQPCLYWSLAAYHFLSRAGEKPVIHIGVRSQAGEALSHAWVTVSGETVAGQPDPAGFSEITSLP